MQTKISTHCLAKMLGNAIWAQSQAYKLGVTPLINKYGMISQRLREVIKNRLQTEINA